MDLCIGKTKLIGKNRDNPEEIVQSTEQEAVGGPEEKRPDAPETGPKAKR